MNQAPLVHASTYLTRYLEQEPMIFADDDEGTSITQLVWVYERDEQGHAALSVTLDAVTNSLIISEMDGYSFKQDCKNCLMGFAYNHKLEIHTVDSCVECDDDHDDADPQSEAVASSDSKNALPVLH